jgi:hypothetical protein
MSLSEARFWRIVLPLFLLSALVSSGCSRSGPPVSQPSSDEQDTNASPVYFGRYAEDAANFERRRGAEQINPGKIMSALSMGAGGMVKGSMVFLRRASDFKPMPYVEYYFTRSDSVVWQSSYQWDASRNGSFLLERNVGDYDPSREAFEQRYESLRQEMIEKFGPTAKSEPLRAEPSTVEGETWERSDEWRSDSLRVRMHFAYGQFRRHVLCHLYWGTPPK